MTQSPCNRERGFLLMTVVVVLGVLAVVALMLVTSTSLDNALATRHLESAQLDYIAESGLRHAQWQLSRNGACDNYPNIAEVAFGAGSYSAAVTPASGSPVTVTAVGKLADDTQRVLSRGDVGVFDLTATTTISLVPGPEGKDTFIWDGAHKNSNFGAKANLELNNASAERVLLMSFDLSAVPQGATILAAKLHLWMEGGSNLSNGVIDAHAITRSWFEGEEDDEPPDDEPGATYLAYDGTNPWANPGGDYDPTPVDSITIPTLAQGWHEWDLSALAKGGTQSALATDGVLLRASAGVVDKIKFTSSDGNAAERPRLALSYACECGTPCAAAGGAGTIVISTDSDAELGGLSFQDTDLVEYDQAGDTASLFLDSAAAGMAKKIDAVHVLENGHILLSTKDDTTFAGLSFKKEDLVEYDPVADTATMYLEAETHFENKKNIISVHARADGAIVLSTDGNATLGGLSFSDKDLVLYNAATGDASLFFDGDATTLSKKITGVHVRPNGHIVLTADGDTTLGGLSFRKDQLIDYDPVADTATLFFDGAALFADSSEKLLSVHVGPASGALETGGGGGGSGDTYRDEFNTKDSYAGNDGTLDWATDWLEINESDGAGSGDEKLRDDAGKYQLRLRDNDGGGEGVQREADLSSCASATLSFDYRRKSFDNGNDYVTVDVSANGGGSWTELDRLAGPADESAYTSASHDVSAYMATDTRIRFLTSPTLGGTDELFIDNVEIGCL